MVKVPVAYKKHGAAYINPYRQKQKIPATPEPPRRGRQKIDGKMLDESPRGDVNRFLERLRFD